MKLPLNYYQLRLKKMRQLIKKRSCDALFIYNAEKEDPSLLPWLLGNDIFDTTYLLITNKDLIIFIPEWQVADAKERYTNLSYRIIGTSEKATMIRGILPFITSFKTIGYAGNLPYKEAKLIQNTRLVDVESDIRSIYELKDEIEIKLLGNVARFTRKILENLKMDEWVGKKELELARWIGEVVLQRGISLSHICVTSGSRVKQTTCGIPTTNVIGKNDVVCIDLGISTFTYYADITRCYFLGNSNKRYFSYYVNLKKIVSMASKKVDRRTTSREVLNIIKSEFKVLGMEDCFIPVDLGHGIGTGRHEYPDIGKGNTRFQIGNVFTLEPEAVLPDKTLIRYEDMYFINMAGECQLL